MKLSLTVICNMLNIPAPAEEYKFHPKRNFRFDYAWPEKMIAVEYEGIYNTSKEAGGTGKSGHTTVTGYRKDCEKYNEAAILGWRVLRFTADHFSNKSPLALYQLGRAFGIDMNKILR